jgi:hypothetical protein
LIFIILKKGEVKMKLSVEYDSESNIGTIRHEGIDIQSEADVQKWRSLVLGELARAIPKGQKAWLLVDFNGFNIGKDMVDRYGEVAVEVRAYAKEVIRYNCENLLTSISVRSKAASHGYRSYICQDRQEALKLVEKLKAGDQE